SWSYSWKGSSPNRNYSSYSHLIERLYNCNNCCNFHLRKYVLSTASSYYHQNRLPAISAHYWLRIHPNFHKIKSARHFRSLHSVGSRSSFASTPYQHINWCPSSYYSCCNTYYNGRCVRESNLHSRQRYVMDLDSAEVVGSATAKQGCWNGYNGTRFFDFP